MAEYNSTSKKAEEFINDEKIKATLAFAEAHKDDLELMQVILDKGREYKGLSYAEAATLLECEDPDIIRQIFALGKEIKEHFYGNRIVMFAPLYLSNYCVNGCVYCPYHGQNKTIPRKKLTQEEIREEVIALVKQVHEEHPTHGYRWTAAYIRINMQLIISDNYAYKCYRYLNIKAETKHQVHYKPRKVKDRYPNLIFTTWETVDRPRQVIVSDMTAFKCWYMYFEVTFYFDVFTKEILSWKAAERRGSRNQYIDGLTDVIELLKGTEEPVVLHTDQGSVYASMAYNDLIKDTNIIRSMSRAGKPTDNPVNEALNGWIKEELYAEFHLERYWHKQDFINTIERYVKYYNTQRPCFAIGYDTPENYRKRYYKGELPKKQTFENRVLSPEPKFVQKRRQLADYKDTYKDVSTFEKEIPEKS